MASRTKLPRSIRSSRPCDIVHVGLCTKMGSVHMFVATAEQRVTGTLRMIDRPRLDLESCTLHATGPSSPCLSLGTARLFRCRVALPSIDVVCKLCSGISSRREPHVLRLYHICRTFLPLSATDNIPALIGQMCAAPDNRASCSLLQPSPLTLFRDRSFGSCAVGNHLTQCTDSPARPTIRPPICCQM